MANVVLISEDLKISAYTFRNFELKIKKELIFMQKELVNLSVY